MSDTVNFADLMKTAEQEGGFSLIPDGLVDAVLTKAEAVIASSGNPMLKVQWTITSGPYVKRKLFGNHVFAADNPNAVAMFFRTMQAYGLGKDYWNALKAPSILDGLAATIPVLMDKPVQLEVGHKVFKGEDRNEVKKVMAPAGGPQLVVGAPAVNIPGPSAGVPNVATGPSSIAVPQPVSGGVPSVPQPVAAPAGNDEEPF